MGGDAVGIQRGGKQANAHPFSQRGDGVQRARGRLPQHPHGLTQTHEGGDQRFDFGLELHGKTLIGDDGAGGGVVFVPHFGRGVVDGGHVPPRGRVGPREEQKAQAEYAKFPPGAKLYSWPFKIVREGTDTMQAQFVVLDDLQSLFSLGTFVRMKLNAAPPTASR